MLRDQVLERIVEWAAGREGVRAALLVGSAARADLPADEYSDLDVVLFVDDPGPWLEDETWPREIGEPWITFVEPIPIGHGAERRVLFANGVDADFTLFPALAASSPAVVSEIAGVLQRGARILADREGLLAPMLAAVTALPTPARAERPAAAQVENLVSNVLYHVLWTARKTARGELWVAASCVNRHMAPQLVRLTAWHAATVHDVRDTWHEGRFLERWADERAVPLLHAALTDADAAHIHAALAAVLEVLGLLGPEVGAAVGTGYPREAHERVAAWLAARSAAA